MLDFFEDTVRVFSNPNVTDEMIADLITRLARSGKTIECGTRAFDFASTGGPSSLSTVLVPLYLYALGENVINVAVPGRPAGVIDVLSQIPNYQLNGFDRPGAFHKHFCIHLEANENFAPLDKQLFDYRKKVNAVDNPNLAIASLLSKKIAGGASEIGLDVRVSPFGNFGKNWEQCINNAEKYNRIARLFGLNSKCFLSDASSPYQPFIGRGEALIAISKILNKECDGTLVEHNQYCIEIARRMINTEKPLGTDGFREAFIDNLTEQGSGLKSFEAQVEQIKKQPYTLKLAASNGYVEYDLQEIRRYLVFRQNSCSKLSKYPDPSGIILLHNQGDYVEKDEPILQIRNSVLDLEESFDFFNIKEDYKKENHKREVI